MKWYRLFKSREELAGRLGEEGRKLVRIGERKVCLMVHDDDIFAFDHLCPHNKHSLLEGKVNHQLEIVCPLHGYIYDLADGRESQNRSEDLCIHSIEVRSDGVFLGISD